jgi:GT2 family glycosyltransferase
VNLSVVIVNWNSGPHLSSLLKSFEALREEVARIIVVDNGSRDSSERVALEDPGVNLKQLRENQGFARAANIGIEATSTRYVLLLNPDTRVVAESVRDLLGEMEKRSHLGIACGALLDWDGRSQEQFQIRSLPTISSVVMDALFLEEILATLKRRNPGSRPRAIVEVEQPAAAFWLMRREAWDKIGGFDESFYPAWFEDVDYCKRLLAAGWKIMLFPEHYIFHRGAHTLENMDYREFVEVYYGNLLKYWAKHHKKSLPLVWLPVQLGKVVRRMFAR